jgi:hypothetical protein
MAGAALRINFCLLAPGWGPAWLLGENTPIGESIAQRS